MTNGEYKKLFIQAVEGTLCEEKNKRLANALFLGFKALTELAKYILSEKLKAEFGKKSSHLEIMSKFANRGRKDTANLLDGSFKTYIDAYEQNQTTDKTEEIKNDIKKLAELEEVEEEFKEILDKI